MMKTKYLSRITLASLLIAIGQGGFSQTKQLDVLQDENAQGPDFLIYNNIDAARAEAKRTNKPLFVTFRCVPCHACKGFDAYNSIASLEKTMLRVLVLHEDYPNNKKRARRKIRQAQAVQDRTRDAQQFNMHVKLNHEVG